MWHIMERISNGDSGDTWRVASPSQYGYPSFASAEEVMRATWYGGHAPQDSRFAVVMWPMV